MIMLRREFMQAVAAISTQAIPFSRRSKSVGHWDVLIEGKTSKLWIKTVDAHLEISDLFLAKECSLKFQIDKMLSNFYFKGFINEDYIDIFFRRGKECTIVKDLYLIEQNFRDGDFELYGVLK